MGGDEVTEVDSWLCTRGMNGNAGDYGWWLASLWIWPVFTFHGSKVCLIAFMLLKIRVHGLNYFAYCASLCAALGVLEEWVEERLALDFGHPLWADRPGSNAVRNPGNRWLMFWELTMASKIRLSISQAWYQPLGQLYEDRLLSYLLKQHPVSGQTPSHLHSHQGPRISVVPGSAPWRRVLGCSERLCAFFPAITPSICSLTH